jgi:tetratricopeptide (TPR) repeat protein
MTENRIDLLKAYIEEDPEDPFNIYVLALEYVKSGMHAEALEQFENLQASHSNYLPLYYQFGQLLEQSNQYQEAIKIYNLGENLAKKQSNIKTLNELRSARELLED